MAALRRLNRLLEVSQRSAISFIALFLGGESAWTSAIESDERIQNQIKIYLGEGYFNASHNRRCSLEIATKEFTGLSARLVCEISGISMKLYKSFECELTGLVFNPARELVRSQMAKESLKRDLELATGRGDETETRRLRWLSKKGKLELGPMSYVLKGVSGPCGTEALMRFREAVNSLDNHEFLLSSDLQEICGEIARKFRNGGVHEKIIPYDVCKEAFHKILAMPESYPSRLIAVSPSARRLLGARGMREPIRGWWKRLA